MEKFYLKKALLFTKESDAVWMAYKLLEKPLRSLLEKYRGLKRELHNCKTSIYNTKKRIEYCKGRIDLLSSELVKLSKTRNNVVALGGVIFIVALLLLGAGEAGWGIMIFSLAVVVFFYAVIKNAQIQSAREEIDSLGSEIRYLEEELKNYEEKKRELEGKIVSFRIPPIKVRAFRSYVPLGVARDPTNEGYVFFAPWSKGERIRISIVSRPEAIEEAMRKLVTGENIYFEAVIREKDLGYKVEKWLKKLKLWEKVLSSRSPERILKEVIDETAATISSAIEYEEEMLRLEKLDSESLGVFREVLTDGWVERVKGEMPVIGEDVVAGDMEKMYVLSDVVEQLKGLRSYVKEARRLAAKEEAYTSIVRNAVRDLIRATLPLDEGIVDFILSSYFCRYCADEVYEEYVGHIDFRRWVYDTILGGVDKDPDIVLPHDVVRDFVKEKWREIEEVVYRSLPLPGVRGDEPLEELVEKYRKALKVYSLPFTGADEKLVLSWRSSFERPEVVCRRCGHSLGPGDIYRVYRLRLPVIKGYTALLHEKEEDLSKKSSEIISSVNSSRLHKDQRKTAIGVYEQIVKDFEKENMKIDREIMEAEEHLKRLKEFAAPILAAAASMTLIEELRSLDPRLYEQLTEIISEFKR